MHVHEAPKAFPLHASKVTLRGSIARKTDGRPGPKNHASMSTAAPKTDPTCQNGPIHANAVNLSVPNVN